MTTPHGASFRPDIQGLRAVAVLVVVLSHAGVPGMRGGYVGVDVFFVISGFLITGLLLRDADRGGIRFREFYGRRARRILPAATLVTVVTAAASALLLDVIRAQEVLVDAVWAAAFAANIRFAGTTDYFAQDLPPSPLQHYWSLSVEEQFYLVWPALLAGALALKLRGHRRAESATARRRRVLTLLVLVTTLSLGWSVWQTLQAPTSAYFATPARVWELALGALLAAVLPAAARLPRPVAAGLGWCGLLAIAVATTTYDEGTPFPGVAALLPTLGAALVLTAGVGGPQTGVGRVLSVQPLRYVGDISYSLYLWHWPVLVVTAGYLGRDLRLGESLLLAAVAVVLSVASYHLVENPFRRRPAGGRTLLLAWPAAVCSVVAVSVAGTVALQGASALSPGQPPPGPEGEPAPLRRAAQPQSVLPAVAAAAAAVRADAALPDVLRPSLRDLRKDRSRPAVAGASECLSRRGDTTSRICVGGDPRADRTLVLFGDSHAYMWLPPIEAAARDAGWRVVWLVKLSCTPAAVTLYPAAGPNRECDAWRRWAFGQIERLRPELVVLSSKAPEGLLGSSGGRVTDLPAIAGLWRAGWTESVQRLTSTGARTVLLPDVPGLDRDPLACLARRSASMGRCAGMLRPRTQALNAAVRSAARATRQRYVDLVPWFCAGKVCPMVVGDTVVYRDEGHITATYAKRLRNEVSDALRIVTAREP